VRQGPFAAPRCPLAFRALEHDGRCLGLDAVAALLMSGALQVFEHCWSTTRRCRAWVLLGSWALPAALFRDARVLLLGRAAGHTGRNGCAGACSGAEEVCLGAPSAQARPALCNAGNMPQTACLCAFVRCGIICHDDRYARRETMCVDGGRCERIRLSAQVPSDYSAHRRTHLATTRDVASAHGEPLPRQRTGRQFGQPAHSCRRPTQQSGIVPPLALRIAGLPPPLTKTISSRRNGFPPLLLTHWIRRGSR
jgi:hypothetical protein